MRILAATSNKGKLREIRRILEPLGYEILEPPRKLEVEEAGNSFLENAYLKAVAYYREFGIPSLADDSGLVVEALGGYPGVYSSRFYAIPYGGVEELNSPEDEVNIRKLLRLMKDRENRRAKFVAFVVLYMDGKGFFSQGECGGEIVSEPRGEGGFGYDPVFKPEGFERTMAELSPEEKDSISHRGTALRKLASLLKRCELK
jgi:XTP/dITP diphosphohydrolase